MNPVDCNRVSSHTAARAPTNAKSCEPESPQDLTERLFHMREHRVKRPSELHSFPLNQPRAACVRGQAKSCSAEAPCGASPTHLRSTEWSAGLSPHAAVSCSYVQTQLWPLAATFSLSPLLAAVASRLLIPRSLVRFQLGPFRAASAGHGPATVADRRHTLPAMLRVANATRPLLETAAHVED